MRRVLAVVLSTVWSGGRSRALTLAGVIIIAAILSPFLAVASRTVVDAALTGAGRVALIAGMVYIVGQLAGTVLVRVSSYLKYALADYVAQKIDEGLMRVMLESPGLEHLERADLRDRLEVIRGRTSILMNIVNVLEGIARYGVTTIAALVLLATIHPLLAVVPLMVAPLAVLQSQLHKDRVAALERAMAEGRRHAQYLALATEPTYAKEVRVFGLGPLLRRRYAESRRTHAAELVRDKAVLTGGLAAIALVQAVVMASGIGFAVWLAANGRTSVGAIVMTVHLVVESVTAMEAFAATLGAGGELAGIAHRYIWFLDYRSPIAVHGSNPAPEVIRGGIELRGVSFTYPGTQRRVLHDVSLRIPAGTTLAIVGDNGAGKTTIAKLLLRFYDPDAGEVVVDGVDLRDIVVDEWRAHATAIFQDYASYELVAQEAIGVGAIGSLHDESRVLKAARAAGADEVLQRLPLGLRTQLGLEFDGGAGLSEGERQRIALARGSMPEHPAIVILDEPTASLDARAEDRVFRRFIDMSRPDSGARPVTVIVSHRFSTVRTADRIAVLHDGRIVEVGSHDELMARGGRYAELYTLQAGAYE